MTVEFLLNGNGINLYNYENSMRNPNSEFLGSANNSIFSNQRISGSGYSDNRSINPNGKIDKPFFQGDDISDCWLLSAIDGIAATTNGRRLLNDIVTIKPNGDIQVKLLGAGKVYTYSDRYLKSRNDLADGDLDVRAIELAMADYMKENPQRGKNTINNNVPWIAFKLLSGNLGITHEFEDSNTVELTDKIIDKFNRDNYVAIVWKQNKKSKTVKTREGDEIRLFGNHTYTVKGADLKYVYLMNPFDSSKIISVSREDFKSFFNRLNELYL